MDFFAKRGKLPFNLCYLSHKKSSNAQEVSEGDTEMYDAINQMFSNFLIIEFLKIFNASGLLCT